MSFVLAAPWVQTCLFFFLQGRHVLSGFHRPPCQLWAAVPEAWRRRDWYPALCWVTDDIWGCPQWQCEMAVLPQVGPGCSLTLLNLFLILCIFHGDWQILRRKISSPTVLKISFKIWRPSSRSKATSSDFLTACESFCCYSLLLLKKLLTSWNVISTFSKCFIKWEFCFFFLPMLVVLWTSTCVVKTSSYFLVAFQATWLASLWSNVVSRMKGLATTSFSLNRYLQDFLYCP